MLHSNVVPSSYIMSRDWENLSELDFSPDSGHFQCVDHTVIYWQWTFCLRISFSRYKTSAFHLELGFILTSTLQLVTWKIGSSWAFAAAQKIAFNKNFDNFAIFHFCEKRFFIVWFVRNNISYFNPSYLPVTQKSFQFRNFKIIIWLALNSISFLLLGNI